MNRLPRFGRYGLLLVVTAVSSIAAFFLAAWLPAPATFALSFGAVAVAAAYLVGKIWHWW